MKPINYLEAVLSYKKGKESFKKKVWIVTKYPPHEILLKDTKTIQRLKEEVYGKNYKGIKSMIILEVLNSKIVGYENNSNEWF